jgi:hypothetical protein
MDFDPTPTSEAAVFVDALNASRNAEPAGPRAGAGPLTVLFLKKRVQALRFELADLRGENAVLRAELKAARERGDRLDEHIRNIYASRGWRVVACLRGVRDFFRRLAAAFRPPGLPPACEESA